MFFTSTVAYFETSGTVASRSSPEIAGTGACLTGSIFMAMVPPVARRTTTGLVCAKAVVASRQRINTGGRTTLKRMRITDISFLTSKRQRLYTGPAEVKYREDDSGTSASAIRTRNEPARGKQNCGRKRVWH